MAAKAVLPFGVAIEDTERIQERLLQTAREVIEESGEDNLAVGLYSQLGAALNTDMGPRPTVGVGGGTHLANAQVFLVPSDERTMTASQFARQWREKLADVVGLESLTFNYSTGPSSGAAIEVQLIHDNIERLEAARPPTWRGVCAATPGLKTLTMAFPAESLSSTSS